MISWLDPLLDLLFPAVCPVCGRRAAPSLARPFCAGCWAELPLLGGVGCPICGRAFPGLRAGLACDACQRLAPPYAFARAAAVYRDGMRKAVHALKYDRRRILARPLGALLAEAGDRLLPEPPAACVQALVPVPLHPARQAERGFNQAELLAAPCAARWGLALLDGVLVRTRATRPQTDLDAASRRANVAGAFRVARPQAVAGRRLLLVDDVMTTGATVGAAVDALRRGGAETVGVLVLARTADT